MVPVPPLLAPNEKLVHPRSLPPELKTRLRPPERRVQFMIQNDSPCLSIPIPSIPARIIMYYIFLVPSSLNSNYYSWDSAVRGIIF